MVIQNKKLLNISVIYGKFDSSFQIVALPLSVQSFVVVGISSHKFWYSFSFNFKNYFLRYFNSLQMVQHLLEQRLNGFLDWYKNISKILSSLIISWFTMQYCTRETNPLPTQSYIVLLHHVNSKTFQQCYQAN